MRLAALLFAAVVVPTGPSPTAVPAPEAPIILGGGGSGGGGGGGGGGGSANITVEFDCKSFGQNVTATEGTPGTLNLDYATPVICWADDTTVSGTAVNDTGWVPEVFFAWNWDDTSLGSVTRGGLSMDLGKSVGLVAAHAFKPSAYAETCDGGTNSSHTVTLTVYSMVGGVRESDSATLTVCVENPATTWTAPVAYCDDANCADDAGVPAGTIHGGNGTDLATILEKCDSDGASRRIVLEGGVTFSTTSDVSLGSISCLVESYGGSKAKLRFTGASDGITVNDAGCAGYRVHNVTFAGDGAGAPVEIIGGAKGSAVAGGCFVVLESNVSTTGGEEIGHMTNDDAISNSLTKEQYYIKLDVTATAAPNAVTYARCEFCAWVGGEVSGLVAAPTEHNLRLAHWNTIAIDANLFKDQLDTKHLLALRNNCGAASPPCTDAVSVAGPAAISRNQFLQNDASVTVLFQIGFSGSGSEPTTSNDVDIIANIFSRDGATTGSMDDYIELYTGNADAAQNRFRFIANAADFTGSTSNPKTLVTLGALRITSCAWFGNVMSMHGQSGDLALANAQCDAGTDTVKNNVTYENTGGTGDIMPSLAESADNQIETSDPFDRDGDAPATQASFAWAELGITSSNTALKGLGVVSACATDVLDGESIPQSSDYDAGGCVDDE